MKNKLRVLSADSDPRLRNEMADFFVDKEEFELFHFAYDADQLKEKVAQNIYHIVIINLSLDNVKWLEMLAWLDQHPSEPYVIATSSLTSEAILRSIQEHGIKYFFLKPFKMSELYLQLLEYYNYEIYSKKKTTGKPETDAELMERIRGLVLQEQIDPESKGYDYIVEAIRQIYDQRDLINAVTKQLYPSVASKCGVTNTKVERAIRHSIEHAWQKNGFKNIHAYFEPNTLHQYDKMSNAEFIAVLSDKLLFSGIS